MLTVKNGGQQLNLGNNHKIVWPGAAVRKRDFRAQVIDSKHSRQARREA
jgi:hypothetical protein